MKLKRRRKRCEHRFVQCMLELDSKGKKVRAKAVCYHCGEPVTKVKFEVKRKVRRKRRRVCAEEQVLP